MSGKNLLVPGTSGNKILVDGQDVGWPGQLTLEAWLAGQSVFSAGFMGLTRSAKEIVELLSMKYADAIAWTPTKSTLKAGKEITPGPVLRLAYNQFAKFDSFSYDWRADIRRSAELLLEHLQLNRPSGGGRWRLVGHSQGGLVIVAASKRYAEEHGDDDKAFSELVSHVALLAVPLFGTVNAAEALVRGENLTPKFKSSFLQVSRTWPALYQMLPSWSGSVRLTKNGATTRAEFNMLDDRAWAGIEVDLGLLHRARSTQEYLRDPFSRMNGVNTRILMTRGYPTLNHVRLEAGGMIFPSTADAEPGDTLVPEETTYGGLSSRERARANTFEGAGKTLQHFVVANDPAIATDIMNFFKK